MLTIHTTHDGWRKIYATSLVLAILLSLAGSVSAATPLYWVGNTNGATGSSPTNGSWNTTAMSWSTTSTGTTNSLWVTGNDAIFGGSGNYSVAIPVSSVSANTISFSGSGYSLSAASAQTITLTAASGRESLAAATTNTIGSNVTLSTAQTTIFGPSGSAAGGTLVLASGASVNSTSSGRTLAVDGVGTVVSVQTGAFFRNTSAGAGAETLQVGSGANSSSTLSIDGGTVSAAGAAGVMQLGGGSGSSGILNLNSGALTLIGTAGVVLANTATASGTFNLNGGTATVPKVSKGAGTSAVFNFNGGTLKAAAANATFMTGLDAANVRNGGALINNNAVAITIGQPLLHSGIDGDNAIDGGLTISGSSALMLAGANTYNGPTTVNSGTLVTTTASTGAGSYTVANGAILEVQVNSTGTSLTNSSLTLGTSGATTLNFTLGGNASSTIPAIQDNGALTLGGTVTVNVTGSFDTTSSTNLLISYASGGSGVFAIGSVPAATGGATATLFNSGNQLVLLYAQPAQAVKWAVGNGNWDTTSLNWQPLAGGSALNYVESSPVTFDDTASGSSPITVTLTANRLPASIVNNSTKDYTLSGGFNLITSGSLDKSGSGTLTVAVNSIIAGGTAIHAGTLQVGNGGTSGSLGIGNIANDSALVFNRSDAITVPETISGSGNVTNSGSGTVILAGTNTYFGATVVNAGKLSVLAASTGGGDYKVADGATLEVKSTGTSSYLQMNSLTLGTSGNLTNNFVLEAGRGTITPLVYSVGDVNLNGTVIVNVSGTGLAAGTYLLLQYSGSLVGSGQFAAGALPGVGTVTNDTSAHQLKLVLTTPGLFWDAGNTNNGSTIDAASGTWDYSSTNLVWNNAVANVAFTDGNSAIFAGADGAYDIKLAASVNSPMLTFLSSGYNLTNDVPQTISLLNASTVTPKLTVAAGKTMTIGTNVTINCPSTTYVGNASNAPGGTIIVENGGLLVETSANTFALDGVGTVVSIKTGGVMRDQSGSTSGQIAIGINNNTGNAPTISVDGGTLEIIGNGGALNVGNGPDTAGGILTLNSGSVKMPGGTIRPLTLGVNAGNSGTVNLNGGTLSVAKVTKGNASAFATNNFNGGTLKAVSASFASSFLSGLDVANIRNGGAVIDDGGFAITIDQLLQHSAIAGDNALDGGLVKLGAGTLTLSAANTYTGNTTISNGSLVLTGSGAIGSSASVNINAGATFDVSAVAPYNAGTGQTIAGNGSVNGSMQVDGKLLPGTSGVGTLTFNNNLTINGNLLFELDKSLAQSNDLVVVAGTLNNLGTGTLTVSNLGPALVVGDKFNLFSQPLPNGNALTIVPPAGVTFTNNLNVDGSIQVLSAPSVIAPNPTNITYSVSGNKLTLTWPADHLGWIAQSNSIALANTNFWFDIPGSDAVTSLTNSIDPGLTNVFYRLRHP